MRQSLLQNASTLACTAGSRSAIAPIIAEWGETPGADVVAALGRFEHYMSLTVGGRRIGPAQITGPRLDDVFADLARPRRTGALEQAARATARTAPLDQLTARAAGQPARVTALLASLAPDTARSAHLPPAAANLDKKEFD